MKKFHVILRFWIWIVLLFAASDTNGQKKDPYIAQEFFKLPERKLAYTNDGSKIAIYDNYNSSIDCSGCRGYVIFNKDKLSITNEKWTWEQWNSSHDFAFLPNNSHYAIVNYNYRDGFTISIKDIKKNIISLTWDWKKNTYYKASTLNISPSLNLLACTHLSDIKIWDYTNSKEISSFATRNDYIRASEFSPNGLLFASAGHSGIHLLDVYAGKGQYIDGKMASVAFSPNGQSIAGASPDGYVQSWNLDNYLLINLYIKTEKKAKNVIYSPDGLFIAIETENDYQIYNIKNKEMVYHYDNPIDQDRRYDKIANIGFSPDGRFFSYVPSDSKGHYSSNLCMLNIYQILGKYMYAHDFARDSINSPLFAPKSEFESVGNYEIRKQQAEKYKWVLIEKYGQQYLKDVEQRKAVIQSELEAKRAARQQKIQTSYQSISLNISNISTYDAEKQQFELTINEQKQIVKIPASQAQSFKENYQRAMVKGDKQLLENGETWSIFNIQIQHPLINAIYPFGEQRKPLYLNTKIKFQPPKIISDRDKDGIADTVDDCPDVAGLALFKGCPDSDKDGIPDKADKCPQIAGIAALNGCPEIKVQEVAAPNPPIQVSETVMPKTVTAAATVSINWYRPRESEVVGKTLYVQQPTLPIDLEVKSSIPLTIHDLKIFLNNQPYQAKYGETDLQNNAMNNGAYYQTFSQKITFPKTGRFTLQVKVVQKGALLGESLPIQIEYKPDEPIHLWVLSVGAKSNLRWTTADAKDFGHLFENQAGEGRLYRQVTTEVLTDENADVSGILKQLNRIKTQYENGILTSKDMIILFFSSHGDNPNGTFYLQPTRYVRENPEKTGISWADIDNTLKNVPCKKLLFLDACKSGTIKADPKRIMEARNQQIKAREGWAIFTSSDMELSYEDDAWQNGSFTEAIVEGLVEGKADKNGDEIISTQELADYIAKRVLQLNEKAHHNLQYPQFKNKLPTDLPLFEIHR